VGYIVAPPFKGIYQEGLGCYGPWSTDQTATARSRATSAWWMCRCTVHTYRTRGGGGAPQGAGGRGRRSLL